MSTHSHLSLDAILGNGDAVWRGIDLSSLDFAFKALLYSVGILFAVVLVNVLQQILFQSKNEPPVVFHWFPILGNTITYGMDPYKFFKSCQQKYGNVFTFVMLGKKMTCCLGIDGNDFILNGKLQDTNAEEIYGPLTIPVFGSDVVYDCPNAKFMEQKKFVKFGLTQKALESYVQLIEKEVLDYINGVPSFSGQRGTIDIAAAMAEVTLFTASRALQGEEVRRRLTADFASLYHDLDLGFRPINFVMPWAPIPQNRRRDAAHIKMREVYMDVIKERRKAGSDTEQRYDMISNLMNCTYKNGQPIPDKEIAHMMITLLMGGQHSSASASSWILLRLASRPDVVEELYQEQLLNLARDGSLRPLQYSDLDKLPLLHGVIKETLRLHSSIHSIMRKVKNPLKVPGTPYTVTADKVLLASPMMTAMSDEHFPNALDWDPHRWLHRVDEEESDEMVDYGYGAVSKGSKSPYLPFGAGRHRCIGEKFAYLNLGVIVSTIVRQFKLNTLDGKSTVPPTDHASMFSKPMQPSLIRWERRSSTKQ